MLRFSLRSAADIVGLTPSIAGFWSHLQLGQAGLDDDQCHDGKPQ
jgi:hypothetical protein